MGPNLSGLGIGELELLELLDTQRTYLSVQRRFYDDLRLYYHSLIDMEQLTDRDYFPADAFARNG